MVKSKFIQSLIAIELAAMLLEEKEYLWVNVPIPLTYGFTKEPVEKILDNISIFGPGPAPDKVDIYTDTGISVVYKDMFKFSKGAWKSPILGDISVGVYGASEYKKMFNGPRLKGVNIKVTITYFAPVSQLAEIESVAIGYRFVEPVKP